METEYIKLDSASPDPEVIGRAGDILKRGGLVAFPTETVYGLGGDALNTEAARKIYEAKGRPSNNPLIVHISELSQLEGLVEEIPELAKKCAEQFWPGPLTMILKKKPIIPDTTSGGLDTYCGAVGQYVRQTVSYDRGTCSRRSRRKN